MLLLISNLIECLRLWLTIKSVRLSWELENEVEANLNDRRDEIRMLRDSLDAADRERADRLLRTWEARQGLTGRLRAEVHRLAREPPGDDTRRPVDSKD